MKKVTLILLVLLTLATSAAAFTVGGGYSLWPPREAADNHRFFYDSETWPAVGYYPGLHVLALEPNPTNQFYRPLIDQLAANNINLLRVVLTFNTAVEATPSGTPVEWRYPYRRATSGGNTYSANQHGLNRKKFDLDQFNYGFFTYWRSLVSYANSKGVVVQVAFYEANHIGSNASGQSLSFFPYYHSRPYDLFDQDNNVNGVHFANQNEWFTKPQIIDRQKAFIREVVKNLCWYKNIIWEIANEPPGNYTSWHNTMRSEIRNTEVLNGCYLPHMIMPIDLPEHRDVAGHTTPGQNTNFVGVHSGLLANRNQYSQPLITDNDCCTNAGSAADRRKKAWTALVSGAHPSLFHFSLGPNNLSSAATAMKWVGNTKKMVDQFDINLSGMVPQDQVVSSSSGGPVWCLAKLWDRYIVYFLDSGSASLSMLPSSYQAFWFDPRNGTSSPATPGPGNTFTAPAGGDWALYIEAQ